MRLSELTGYKSDPIYNILQNSTNAEELEDKLESNGFNKYVVGTGLYSSVLSRPDLNYVVKIFDRDPGYETYLKYIIKYQDNPHVPKLRGKVISVGPRFKVVRLEKLQPMDVNNLYHSKFDNDLWNYVYGDQSSKDELTKQFPQIIPLLTDIMKHKAVDLHDQNFMFRGSVPVITDPLSGFSTR